MFELPLHTGTEHANLVAIVVPSIAAFAAGLGLGTYADRIGGFLKELATGTTE